MKRYFINEVKVGETAGDIACGPVGGNIVATVKYTSSGKTEWLNLVEVDGGFSCFYQTEKDCFDDLVKEDFEDSVILKTGDKIELKISKKDEYGDSTFIITGISPENVDVTERKEIHVN